MKKHVLYNVQTKHMIWYLEVLPIVINGTKNVL